MPRKLYLSPTYGISDSLPANISHLFLSESATYRKTVTKSQLECAGTDEDIPPGFCDSYAEGYEKMEKKVMTIFGEEEIYVSWDSEGLRYFVEFENLEETLQDIYFATGLRLTLDFRDREDPYNSEFIEAIYGLPMIDENDLTCEIETDVPDLGFAGNIEEGEEWKQGY